MSYSEPRIRKPATNKARTYLSERSTSLSNSTSFSKFIEKDIIKDGEDVVDFKITIVPKKSNLYQGTDFEFNLEQIKNPTQDDINSYFDYYNDRHEGAYFVSTKKVASMYGLNQNSSTIVYAALPSIDDIYKIKQDYKYIYPLYYIPGYEGVNIKYKLKKNLFLINIGDEKNIKFLWKLIEKTSINKDPENIQLSKNILLLTCAKYKDDATIQLQTQSYIERIMSFFYLKSKKKTEDPPIECKRISIYTNDDKLVLLFKNLFIPEIKKNYNIDIDGWIYFNSSDFHEEILLKSNESLIFDSITAMKKNKYFNIPTIKEFSKLIEDKKIVNNHRIKPHTILSNNVYILPEKK
jgi:hypothetical protein